MKINLNDVMTPAEACYRWGIPPQTLNSRLNGQTKAMAIDIEKVLNEGLAKRFTRPGKVRSEWILTVELLERWYGPETSEK